MLKQFDLHHDVEKLANAGIERPNDLTYLDEDCIQDLPDLTPMCKLKLGKLIASCASAKSASSRATRRGGSGSTASPGGRQWC